MYNVKFTFNSLCKQRGEHGIYIVVIVFTRRFEGIKKYSEQISMMEKKTSLSCYSIHFANKTLQMLIESMEMKSSKWICQ